MLRQIQELQARIQEAQEALGRETVTATVGGGAVTVVMTGHHKVVSVRIDPDVVNSGDVEILQDLIVAGINEALEKSQALAEERLGPLTAGLGILGVM
ncbi:MAG: YbaB/EbfC family nucleoid-associated protein [Chloroflexi bacterium]|nr:YbaB/EbfC family nucleoid-associated protein [Chloroflexota bacterium]